jgi:uncharacterized protein YciW
MRDAGPVESRDTLSATAESFRGALSKVHDEIAQIGTLDTKRALRTADPVADIARQILPSPWAAGLEPKRAGLTAGSAGPVEEAFQSNEVLKQTFDHAITVTLVSQVMSGVSQAASTLIRQQ